MAKVKHPQLINYPTPDGEGIVQRQFPACDGIEAVKQKFRVWRRNAADAESIVELTNPIVFGVEC
jgi:hypothetical protein